MENGRLIKARLAIACLLTGVLVFLLLADVAGVEYVIRPTIIIALTLSIGTLLVGARK